MSNQQPLWNQQRCYPQFLSFQKQAEKDKLGYWKYGGKQEFNWILEKGQKPFSVEQMSQGLWGVKYDGFCKTRLNNEQLLIVLNELRRWVNELHEDDLAKQLLNSGWERGDVE